MPELSEADLEQLELAFSTMVGTTQVRVDLIKRLIAAARRTPSGEAAPPAPSPPAEVVEALRNLHEVACNYETTRSGDLSAALNKAGRILDGRG